MRSGFIRLAILAAHVSPAAVGGQASSWQGGHLPVGGEWETYARTLQLVDRSLATPSIRPYTRSAWTTEAAHPWARLVGARLEASVRDRQGATQPRFSLHLNSSFPFGDQDGAVWTGRGLTVSAQWGGVLRRGPLVIRVAPLVFLAQNLAFDLAPNGEGGQAAFRDAEHPNLIDRPQRFGDGVYGRVDPGESSITMEARLLNAGVSTSSQHWGPTYRYPLVLGNNAGGFPHVFLGTTRPVQIGVGDLYARYSAGRLGESRWSPNTGPRSRLATGLALAFRPRGLRGLELGVTRFVHHMWPANGVAVSQLLRPFGLGLTNPTRGRDDPGTARVRGENQLAGVFFRWLLPTVEVYAELMRDDFGRDLRHYLVEPDDLLARTFGVRRLMRADGAGMRVFRAEMLTSATHHSERADRYRSSGPGRPLNRYRHRRLPQGHTHRGQTLASPAAYTGSAWTLGLDTYHLRGRWTLEIFRQLRQDGAAADADGGSRPDVFYGVVAEVMRRNSEGEHALKVVPVLNLNRNLVAGRHVLGLHVSYTTSELLR